ncbi:MAG TPA: hypothetical protein VHG28_20590 [Longimicrobiaceae bacterium]|nr:hypothetical protein [Longimicrobiaceae bacterium]
MRRFSVGILFAATLAGIVPTPVSAQLQPRKAEVRGSLEYFVARNRLTLGGGPTELDGVGGRILWPLTAVTGTDALPLASRIAVGGYVVHTPRDAEEMEMWHYGMQADLLVPVVPAESRIDPLLSLGVGAVRVDEPTRIPVPAQHLTVIGAPGKLPALRTERTHTDLSLVPGVGARLRLLPGVDFRSDLRMVIDFRDRTRRNLEMSGGISIPT